MTEEVNGENIALEKMQMKLLKKAYRYLVTGSCIWQLPIDSFVTLAETLLGLSSCIIINIINQLY